MWSVGKEARGELVWSVSANEVRGSGHGRGEGKVKKEACPLLRAGEMGGGVGKGSRREREKRGLGEIAARKRRRERARG